jgi:hypothetical protein
LEVFRTAFFLPLTFLRDAFFADPDLLAVFRVFATNSLLEQEKDERV